MLASKRQLGFVCRAGRFSDLSAEFVRRTERCKPVSTKMSGRNRTLEQQPHAQLATQWAVTMIIPVSSNDVITIEPTAIVIMPKARAVHRSR